MTPMIRQRSAILKELDQFYTRPELARSYVKQIIERWPEPDVLFVEPAAGDGAFLQPLLDAKRKVSAIDISPQSAGIIHGDFLKSSEIFLGEYVAVVVIGNPPFGKNGCSAVKFFNHASAHADEIAFIVPRTFRKMSIQKRLHASFHLSNDSDVEPNAFLRFGRPHDVPCAWQIWTRRHRVRKVPVPPAVDHLIHYTTPTLANFAMRRVGFYAGRVVTSDLGELSRTTHYFMQEMADGVIDALRQVDWSELVSQTAGVRSLSKTEIAFKLNEIYDA